MCCPCPNKCNWSLWFLVGTCWRRRTTASTAHGGDLLESNSQNPSIKSEIYRKYWSFLASFSFILVPIDRKAADRLGLTGLYFATKSSLMQGIGKRNFWRVKPTPLLATCTITERLYGESQNSVLCLPLLLHTEKHRPDDCVVILPPLLFCHFFAPDQ